MEEILRYCPVVLGAYRVASADATLGDLDVPAGTIVQVLTSAANRDPAVIDDPDHFDITRCAPVPQLSSAGGIHSCLGVHLAKAEMLEALRQMSRRWSTIEQTAPAPWKPRAGVSGPARLPIVVNRPWRAGARRVVAVAALGTLSAVFEPAAGGRPRPAPSCS